METPIKDDEFDILWEKAAAEARQSQSTARPHRLPQKGKEPSERRKPRADNFPALSPQSGPKHRVAVPNRRVTDVDLRPTVDADAARRSTVIVRPLPSPLEPAASRSPKLERKGSRDTKQKTKIVRRHSSMELDEIRIPHRNSTLPVSDELLQDSMITQISFSNLPNLTELMKKPTIGTAATTTSDFSSTKQMASKNWSEHSNKESGNSSTTGDLRKSAQSKKVSVEDAQLRVADHILNLPQNNGSSTPQISLPTIHSISSFKENKDQLSGLVISRDAGCEVLVKKIQPNSIFTNTPLQRGHEILTINDRRVKCPSRATTIIKSINGEVNLLVSEGERPPGTKYIKAKMERLGRSESIAESVSVKSFGDRDLGLHLEQSRHGLVRVASIDDDSVFSGTPVRRDDIVLAVNGETAQSVDIAMTSLGRFHRRGGVAILLVYSMIDLRLGLLDRIVQSPWEVHWNDDCQSATISKKPAAGEDHFVSFCVVFDDDWSCDLIPSNTASPSEKEEINLVIDRLNDSISRAVKCWSDAVQVSKEDQFTAAC